MPHVIKISNCNNITEVEVPIHENSLNIFWGQNGTGKSTIAQVIAESTKPHPDYKRFIPYGNASEPKPTISDHPYHSVAIFNAEYIKSYTYQQKSLHQNAFDVFVRTKEYEESKDKTDAALASIRGQLFDDEEISNMRKQIGELLNTVKLNRTGNIDRRGAGRKVVDEGMGAYFNPPQELQELRPFFVDTLVAPWADWRLQGMEKYGTMGVCPYCAHVDDTHSQTITNAFKKSFDKQSVAYASNIKKAIDGLDGYIAPSKANDLLGYFGTTKNAEAFEVSLSKLVTEAQYLQKKLLEINSFNITSIDRDKIGALDEILRSMQIEANVCGDYFSAEKAIETIEKVNHKIGGLRQKVNELRAIIGRSKKQLETAIKDRENDINEVLSIAGFPYSFHLSIEGDAAASAYIEYRLQDGSASEHKASSEGLSWGERHAFALVMFMFDAISKQPDLIILDDPISSFDSNKKYALMHRLFMTGRGGNSLYQKTVLLLTHDLQPVIDYVQVGGRIMSSDSVAAYYAQNVSGTIQLSQIRKNTDILSCVLLMSELAQDNDVDIAVRVSALRKYIENTVTQLNDDMAYHILSSIIHGREQATKDQAGEDLLSIDEYNDGLKFIRGFIPDFDYALVYDKCQPEKLLSRLEGETNYYEKIVMLRLYSERKSEFRTLLYQNHEVLRKYVDETFHIENDYMYMLDIRKHNIVPRFIQAAADTVISDEINKQPVIVR